MTGQMLPCSPDDLRHAISYALKFSDTGKPLGVRQKADIEGCAARVAAHLERAGYLVLKRVVENPQCGLFAGRVDEPAGGGGQG